MRGINLKVMNDSCSILEKRLFKLRMSSGKKIIMNFPSGGKSVAHKYFKEWIKCIGERR